MIENIELLRRSMQCATSAVVHNYFAKQHQAAIKEWRAVNALKVVKV